MGAENVWFRPDGYEERPLPIRYRVRDLLSGMVVERVTAPQASQELSTRWRWFHAVNPADQHLGDKVAALVQEACAYFYASDADYKPMTGVSDIVISDDEVLARIERIDQGENTREAERVGKRRYPLVELPFEQQRALVERIEALKRDWQFEWIGEAEA